MLAKPCVRSGAAERASKAMATRSLASSAASARCSARGTARSRRVVTCMAKKVTGVIKLAIEAGKASPAPPIGPALGSKGVNIMGFCKEYNAATAQQAGMVIPVEITVYEVRQRQGRCSLGLKAKSGPQ